MQLVPSIIGSGAEQGVGAVLQFFWPFLPIHVRTLMILKLSSTLGNVNRNLFLHFFPFYQPLILPSEETLKD